MGDLEAQVSPDGRQVAFLRNDGEMGGDIYVTGTAGGPVRRMTFDNRDIMGFCWRPDGEKLCGRFPPRRWRGEAMADRGGQPGSEAVDGWLVGAGVPEHGARRRPHRLYLIPEHHQYLAAQQRRPDIADLER